MTKPKYPIAQVIAEMERELKMRKQVYPRLIRQKKITRAKALEQYWLLEQGIELLKAKYPQGVQPKLFDDEGYLKTTKEGPGKNQFD